MRILYHHRIASKDGQFVHVEELIGALRRAGHHVTIVGPKTVEISGFGSEGGIVRRFKNVLPRIVYELMELFYGFLAYFRLRRAAKHHRPDVIYERYNLFLPAGVWVAKRLRVPLLLEVNAPLFEERNTYDGMSLRAIASWIEKYVWNNADVTLPVTHVLADYLKSSGVADAKIRVIPNGVDLEKFENLPSRDAAKAEFGFGSSIVLGFVGFIRTWHRLDIIIKALQDPELSHAVFFVIGEGPARAQLESEAESHGVADRVRFSGLVQRQDLPRYMAAFDMALQPNVVSYASPLKMFEYMAMSLPIIAPDTPNIREILTDGVDALLVTDGDADAMRRTLIEAVRDKELREKIGHAARCRIDSGAFTWDHNAREVISIAREMNRRKFGTK